MATGETNLLFSWDAVERLPDLRCLSMALEHLPDAELVAALEERRGLVSGMLDGEGLIVKIHATGVRSP